MYNINMSMSTNIADLPGPVPEDIEEIPEEIHYQDYQDDNHHDDHNEYIRENNSRPPAKEIYYEQPTSMKMDIKKLNKKEHFEEQGTFDILRKEINEENLLILVVLFIATSPYADVYTKKLLELFSFNTTSSFTFNIIKCVALLIIFIVIKLYVLPSIKL